MNHEGITISIIGNPNSGKSTIFNSLTGMRQKVGNWPGVTIEKKIGILKENNKTIKLVDLPGIYSLGPAKNRSLDQDIAIKHIRSKKFDAIINVVDSTNFERNLYLTLQLIEQEVPIILLLNMDDLAKKKSISINQKSLSESLGCPVIKVSAKNNASIKNLRNILLKYTPPNKVPNVLNLYQGQLKTYYQNVLNHINKSDTNYQFSNLIELLENKANYITDPYITKETLKIESKFGQDINFIMVNSRYAIIKNISKLFINMKQHHYKHFSDIIDNVLMNSILSIPIFFLTIYLMLMISIRIGNLFRDFFESFAEITFIDAPKTLLHYMYESKWIDLLIDGVGGGIQTVFSFIPVIATLYVILAFLEGTGYIARTGIIFNRFMKKLNMSGNSIFPLIIGLGCNVPAVLGSRIIVDENSRITTVLMTPFVSCTARLAVYTLFCMIFFPHNTQNTIFFLYILGISAALSTGVLLKNNSPIKQNFDFLMELPEYKLPKLKNLLENAFIKTKSFMIGAGKTIVVVFFIVHTLNTLKINSSNHKKDSIVNIIGKKSVYLFKPLGIEEKNWEAAVSLLAGIFAKEVVIGTLTSLHSEGNSALYTKQENLNLLEKYKKVFYKLVKKLKNIFNNSYHSIINTDAVNLDGDIKKNIRISFNNKITVLSYLIFVSIYFPCGSMFGIISQELGTKWALLSAFWSTSMAYSISTIFCQTMNFFVHGKINYLFWVLGVIILAISASLTKYFSKIWNNNSLK